MTNKIAPSYTVTKGIKLNTELKADNDPVALPQGRVYDYHARFCDEQFMDENRELIIPDFRASL